MMNDLISRQAAIDILMKEWKAYKDYPYVSHVRDGLEIAIMILENKVPSAQPNLQPTCNQLATDCISRQAAIDAIREDADWLAVQGSDWQEERMERDKSILMSLPFAQPNTPTDAPTDAPTDTTTAQRKGKWIYLNGLEAFECSVCGRQMVRNIFDYCPWCGARMEVETIE